MDNLTYFYYTRSGVPYDPLTDPIPDDATNKLTHVTDNKNAVNYDTDIENQNTMNYQYDQIGNLVSDESEGIQTIEWTVYGKIKSITRQTGFSKVINGNTTYPADLEFHYDATGNRISKIVKPRPGGNPSAQNLWTMTFYIRDASGNVMATYSKAFDTQINTDKMTLTEQHLYGSSRIGILNRNTDLSTGAPITSLFNHTTGNKQFELSNHLGNVLITVSDRKLQENLTDAGTIGVTDYYTPDISSVNDYGVWGDLLPQRHTASQNYRFGFNGKEKTDEWNGIGEANYDYGFRIYDPRIGKFLSVDPLSGEYPELTPYQYASNDPIKNIDIDGLEGKGSTTPFFTGFGSFGISFFFPSSVEKKIDFNLKPAINLTFGFSASFDYKFGISNSTSIIFGLGNLVPFVPKFGNINISNNFLLGIGDNLDFKQDAGLFPRGSFSMNQQNQKLPSGQFMGAGIRYQGTFVSSTSNFRTNAIDLIGSFGKRETYEAINRYYVTGISAKSLSFNVIFGGLFDGKEPNTTSIIGSYQKRSDLTPGVIFTGGLGKFGSSNLDLTIDTNFDILNKVSVVAGGTYRLSGNKKDKDLFEFNKRFLLGVGKTNSF